MNQFIRGDCPARHLTCHRLSRSFMVPVVLLVMVLATACAPALPEKKQYDLVWPLPPDEPRIKYVDVIRGTFDLGRKTGIAESIFGETEDIGFKEPYGVAVDAEGKIYVTKVTTSLYFEDGTIMNNNPATYGHTDDDVAGATNWLGDRVMPIMWVCPYGFCDFFGRGDMGTLCKDADYCNGEAGIDDWVLDTNTDDGVCDEAGELCISTNTVKSAADGTGIAHWSGDLGNTTQYAQIKITSTSTDGDVGLILRSGASSGYRYAVTYDESWSGGSYILWRRYDWNTLDTYLSAFTGGYRWYCPAR